MPLTNYQNQGIGKRLLARMLDYGREFGIGEVWILTHRSNTIAMRLYESAKGCSTPEDVIMYSFDLQKHI
ncbi:MAG: GNAT family N-acetyltransferase [Chloroflexi bacterium]|nr:GNAT family N-acetyltransferase [Chloroflexota bacterium]